MKQEKAYMPLRIHAYRPTAMLYLNIEKGDGSIFLLSARRKGDGSLSSLKKENRPLFSS